MSAAHTPYRGLVPFREEDARYFFGRERIGEVIAANLRTHRLTLLYGQSGVGKSSVLRAGVLPLLEERDRQAVERGRKGHRALVFDSWHQPVDALLQRIRAVAPDGCGAALAGASTLAGACETWSRCADMDLLVVLDQFEEYFLYRSDSAAARAFVDDLAAAVNHRDGRVHFLVSIREDALALLDLFKGRIPNLFGHTIRLPHLDDAAARNAIAKPVERFNEDEGAAVAVEPELVDAVLRGIRRAQSATASPLHPPALGDDGEEEDPIEAPYLQLVMEYLWKMDVPARWPAGSQRRATLELATLEGLEDDALGLSGVDVIVEQHLKRSLDTLSPEETTLCTRMLRQLVTPSGTKIAHTLDDLATYAETEPERVRTLLERLGGSENRILRRTEGGRYEIFHDVLARPILEWVAERERQAARREAREHERRRTRQRLFVWALPLLLGVLLLVSALWFRAENARAATASALADVHFERGVALASRGEIVPAVLSFEAANAARAESVAAPEAEAHFHRGRTLAREGDFEGAEAQFVLAREQGRDIEPTRAAAETATPPLLERARELHLAQRPEEAAEAYAYAALVAARSGSGILGGLVCRQGGEDGFASEVQSACELAAVTAPDVAAPDRN